MQFKKEFDIDKDFFEEKDKGPSKRQMALRVFVLVLFLTFGILCYSAFTFNFNTRFGAKKTGTERVSLKEAQSYFFDAVKYYEQGDYTKAVDYLNKQLLIVDDPDAYNYLAKIYLEQGNTTSAIDNFKKAVEFNPDFFEANYELGKIYFSLNDYKTASKYLEKASNSKPEDAEVLSLAAESYKMSGRADEAVSLFEKIIKLEPDNAFANAKIGEIYFQRLEYKKAISYLEDSLQITFEPNTAIYLAKCYFEIGSLEAALSVVNDILAEDKENKQAQSLKKAAEYKMGLSAEKASLKETPQKPQVVQKAPVDPSILNNYIKEIESPIKMNWTPPMGSNLKKASVKFTVNKEGELISNVLYQSSGMVDFDKSALDAIELSKPFPPLPSSLGRETLDIIFTFDFNVNGR